jgi:hypothetical protein
MQLCVGALRGAVGVRANLMQRTLGLPRWRMASCEFAGLELRLFGLFLVRGFVLADGDILVARENVLY